MITGLAVLPADFLLSGMSVYLLEDLRAPSWLPGAVLALLTGLTAAGGTAALRLTRRLRRTTVMAAGAALSGAWCAASLAALALPPGWRPAEMLAATVVMAAAETLFQSRVNALAEALAPAGARSRYLAAFQYAFTVPGVLAPAVVALFAVAVWLPWLLVGARRRPGGPGPAGPGRAPARRCPAPGSPARGGSRHSRASSIRAARPGSAASTYRPPPIRSVAQISPEESTNKSLICGTGWPGGGSGTQCAISAGCPGSARS